MKTSIVIKTQFEAMHYWPECPFDDVAFLRNLHRHIFYIKVKFTVSKDREIEFIKTKREIEHFLIVNYNKKNIKRKSCEMIAAEILNRFSHANFVSVFEDNENGAEVVRE